MPANRYPFDGQQMTVAEIQARYPAYSRYQVRRALTQMQPPAADLHGLVRWELEVERRRKWASRIGAALSHEHLLVNSKTGFADPELKRKKIEWAKRQLSNQKTGGLNGGK